MNRGRALQQANMTLDECAERLFVEGLTKTRVTRERIRQIETRAIRKLRAALEAEGLTFQDLFPEGSWEESDLPRVRV